MKGKDGFIQGYNCQAAVEDELQLIVGQTVTPQANDKLVLAEDLPLYLHLVVHYLSQHCSTFLPV